MITKLPPWAIALQKRVSGPVSGTASGPYHPGSQVFFEAEPGIMTQECHVPSRLSPPEICLFWSIRTCFHSIPDRLSCRDNLFFLILTRPLHANSFLLAEIFLLPGINVFSYERWWPLSVPCCGEGNG